MSFLITIVFSSYYVLKNENGLKRTVLFGGLLGTLIIGVWSNVQIIFVNIAAPHQWGFQAFYLNGKMAAAELNF